MLYCGTDRQEGLASWRTCGCTRAAWRRGNTSTTRAREKRFEFRGSCVCTLTRWRWAESGIRKSFPSVVCSANIIWLVKMIVPLFNQSNAQITTSPVTTNFFYSLSVKTKTSNLYVLNIKLSTVLTIIPTASFISFFCSRTWMRFLQEIFVLFLGSTVLVETLLHPGSAPVSPWWITFMLSLMKYNHCKMFWILIYKDSFQNRITSCIFIISSHRSQFMSQSLSFPWPLNHPTRWE